MRTPNCREHNLATMQDAQEGVTRTQQSLIIHTHWLVQELLTHFIFPHFLVSSTHTHQIILLLGYPGARAPGDTALFTSVLSATLTARCFQDRYISVQQEKSVSISM